MKALQIGSFDRNLGDNIALLNVRKAFEDKLGEIEWESLFFGIKEEGQAISLLNKTKYDFIVVGGGGLIESYGFSGCKIPFTKKALDSIKVPIFFIGLGYNFFYNGDKINNYGADNLSYIIEKSNYFSLRDDGSLETLRRHSAYFNKDINVIPDPGCMYKFEKQNFLKTDKLVFQPAFNSNQFINKNRYPNNGINKIKKIISEYKFSVFPHTPKDFYIPDLNFIIKKTDINSICKFQNTEDFLSEYLNFKTVVATRGHGQLISIGLNIPSLYLSTQPKVIDFSNINGFSEYTIDIRKDKWEEDLKSKIENINQEGDFRNKWFDLRKKYITNKKLIFNDAILKCVNHLK